MTTPLKDVRTLIRSYEQLLKKYPLEFRMYQLWLMSAILKAYISAKNILIELDAGMGKRILIFLLTQLFNKKRILILTPSRASVWDMYRFFRAITNLDSWLGIITSGTPSLLRRRALEKMRVVIATPTALLNTFIRAKEPHTYNFDIIIINEVDKTVKRLIDLPSDITSNKPVLREYALIYPWNKLANVLPNDALWIGLSGTLRDKHYIKLDGQILLKPELESIVEFLFPKEKTTTIISMNALIEKTDLSYHIIKNLTIIHPIGVSSKEIVLLDKALREEIEATLSIIKNRYSSLFLDNATIFETYEKISHAVSLLPRNDPYKIKFLRLALARRFIYASTPQHYRRFLDKPMFHRIISSYTQKTLFDLIPEVSPKITFIRSSITRWIDIYDRVIILTSFIRTALAIKRELEHVNENKLFLLTGQTRNKKGILESFYNISKSILILTPVAERDIDFPPSSLLVIHDIISTVKSMYQRIKRVRRGHVIILYYKDTFEEHKLRVLLSRISTRYPWSIRILNQ